LEERNDYLDALSEADRARAEGRLIVDMDTDHRLSYLEGLTKPIRLLAMRSMFEYISEEEQAEWLYSHVDPEEREEYFAGLEPDIRSKEEGGMMVWMRLHVDDADSTRDYIRGKPKEVRLASEHFMYLTCSQEQNNAYLTLLGSMRAETEGYIMMKMAPAERIAHIESLSISLDLDLDLDLESLSISLATAAVFELLPRLSAEDRAEMLITQMSPPNREAYFCSLPKKARADEENAMLAWMSTDQAAAYMTSLGHLRKKRERARDQIVTLTLI